MMTEPCTLARPAHAAHLGVGHRNESQDVPQMPAAALHRGPVPTCGDSVDV